MQLALTFSVPSSNHLMSTEPGVKLVFLTLVKGLIQSMRLPCSAQNASGFETDSAYIALYCSAVTWALATNAADGAYRVSVLVGLVMNSSSGPAGP